MYQAPQLKFGIMGILNITPDSFFAKSRVVQRDEILARAHQMVEDGATILDIGGESTRPGALPVPLQEELDRVIPVIEWLKAEIAVPLSIDTYKTEVMAEALGLGVALINDINALQHPGALAVVAASTAKVCLMHKQGSPRTMQESPAYRRVLEEILDFFDERLRACQEMGIDKTRIMLDPGIGFGKTLSHNLHLLKHLRAIAQLGCPVLIGVSRKSMIGQILNLPPEERLVGSMTLTTIAALNGASVFRTHDVGATYQALAVVRAYLEENG